MKRFFILVYCLIFLFSCEMASNPCSKIREDSLKSEIKKAFNVEFDRIFEKNQVIGTNLCQVVIEKAGNFMILYSTSDIKTLFIGGDVYKDGIFIGKATINRIYEKNFLNYKDEIDKVVAFSYKPEGATKYIYMVTDPDCAFCEKAKPLVKQWADLKKVEVRVILFPLEQIHPQAKEKSIKGICSGITYNDYLNSKWEGKSCEEGVKKIKDSIELMQKIAVNATPSFISHNGKRFVGFAEDGLNKIIE